MGAMVYRRHSCRLCEGSDLTLVLQLTPTPPVDAYVPAAKVHETQEVYPLDLFLCRSCGHVQLLDVVHPDLLFGNYIYETSSSPGLVEHFREYARDVLPLAGEPRDALVVEIGSNDGTLLRFFREGGMRVLGVDPAREIAERANELGLETLSSFFTCGLAREIRPQYGAATLVCANNVFAHADNLADMADGVRHLLAPDGLFVFEVSYILDMIENMVFDFIYHEHLCHHSVKPLRTFLSRHGMELLDVQRIPEKGGSLRGVAQLAGGPRKPSLTVEELITLEESRGLDRPEIFESWARKIATTQRQITALLDELKREGKNGAGYGASATTTVLLYHFHLADYLGYIVDDNSSRQNLFSPGHHIPVVSPQAIYERKPDYLVILAWRFAGMIMSRHTTYLRQGGKFIVPLPKVEMRQ